MSETKIPDYIHSWIEVSAAEGSNRRRLPAVLFDSKEHFDSVRERIAALEAALREVGAALSRDIIEDDNVLDMQRIVALALGERDGVGREGPRITIERSCLGCRWVNAALYANQGDGSHHVSCSHPGAHPPRGIGCSWSTPDWCPVIAASATEETP